MPVDVKVTCDICGERATQYPSFFDLRDDIGGVVRGEATEMTGVFRTLPEPLRISTKGCLRPQGLKVCLCEDHKREIVSVLEDWLIRALVASR